MSVHEQLTQEIRVVIDEMKDAGAREYSHPDIASEVFGRIDPNHSSPELVEYASIQHIKNMSMKILAREFDPIKKDYSEVQEDMFTGLLQSHYPVSRNICGETVRAYVHREDLNEVEFAWNCKRLEKDISGRQEHLDAFKAWWRSRKEAVGY